MKEWPYIQFADFAGLADTTLKYILVLDNMEYRYSIANDIQSRDSFLQLTSRNSLITVCHGIYSR